MLLSASMPEDAPGSMVELCAQCVAYEAEERPEALAVLEWLGSVVEELPETADPDLVELLEIEVHGACHSCTITPHRYFDS